MNKGQKVKSLGEVSRKRVKNNNAEQMKSFVSGTGPQTTSMQTGMPGSTPIKPGSLFSIEKERSGGNNALAQPQVHGMDAGVDMKKSARKDDDTITE
jgi:hypothetical protein